MLGLARLNRHPRWYLHFSKGRDHLQEHVNHLTNVAKIAKETANREQDNLKSENGFLLK